MFRLTEVIKNIVILNVIVFISVYYLFSDYPLEKYFILMPFGQGFEPLQLVTHMFMHGGIAHIAFNMLALIFLGPNVEHALGPKRFLTLYLVAGLVAAAAHLFIEGQHPAVGASGAVIGVVIAFATMFPNVKLIVFPLPFPIRAMFVALAFVAYDLYSGLYITESRVAHFAHLGGAVAGFVMIKYWRLSNLQ
jgi:membrane associated rhomboid family serine protease